MGCQLGSAFGWPSEGENLQKESERSSSDSKKRRKQQESVATIVTTNDVDLASQIPLEEKINLLLTPERDMGRPRSMSTTGNRTPFRDLSGSIFFPDEQNSNDFRMLRRDSKGDLMEVLTSTSRTSPTAVTSDTAGTDVLASPKKDPIMIDFVNQYQNYVVESKYRGYSGGRRSTFS
jgi:hypothetical protein